MGTYDLTIGNDTITLVVSNISYFTSRCGRYWVKTNSGDEFELTSAQYSELKGVIDGE